MYKRQVAIDYQTLEDDTVTIRYRDTMEQERVHKDDLAKIIGEAVSYKNIFKQL